MQVFNYAWCRNILVEIGETKIQKTMTDYSKRCEGPATYGVLVISICIQLLVLYTYGGDVISRCRMLPTLMSYKDLTQST